MDQIEIKNILNNHKLWLDSNKQKGKRADLTGANLLDANLLDANLTGADLTNANLSRANLSRANLTNANLEIANFWDADLTGANLNRAILAGANLNCAILSGIKGLPDIAWIKAGCLAQLNKVKYDFYLSKENKLENFIQDSFGFIIQNNGEENSFDMLIEDRIIRNIPDWVKYSGLKAY